MGQNNKILPPDGWWLDRNNEILCDPIGNIKIGRIYPLSQSNDGRATGKFIIKAAKLHNEMLAELKAVLNGLENLTTEEFSLGKDQPLRSALEKIIAKAEKEG